MRCVRRIISRQPGLACVGGNSVLGILIGAGLPVACRRRAGAVSLSAPVDQQSRYTAQWTCPRGSSRMMGRICCLAIGRSRNTPVAATLIATGMPAAIRYLIFICPLLPDFILPPLRRLVV